MTTGGGTTYPFTVAYEDPTGTNQGIQIAGINGNSNAVRVVGPNGYDVPALFLNVDVATNGSPRTANYSIVPPGGAWDAGDNGSYAIVLQANQVRDLDGNFITGAVGAISVNIPAPPPANDVAGGAVAIGLNRAVNGTLNGAANDYNLVTATATQFTGIGQAVINPVGRDVVFSFTAPAAGAYTFRTRFATGANLVTYVATALTPGDATATVIMAANRNSNTTNASEELNSITLTAGQTVFIVVDEATLVTTASSFQLEVTPAVVEGASNDTTAGATPYVFGIQGSMNPINEVDFFSLPTATGGERLFALVDIAAASASADSQIRITTATDTLEFDDDDADTPFGGLGSSVSGVILAAGANFISVDPFSATTPIFEPYRVYAVVQPAIGSATAEDDAGGTGNNTIGTANGAANNYFSGTLAGATDVDFYGTDAQIGDLLFFSLDTNPLRDNTGIDGNIALFDAAGNLILSVNGSGNAASNTSGAGSLTATTPTSPGENLVYRVTHTGTYYIRVTGTAAGDYLLSVSRNGTTGGGGITPAAAVSSIAADAGLLTNAASVSWTVTTSAPVTGLSAANFVLFATGAQGGAQITGFTQLTPTTVRVTASTSPAGDGTIALRLFSSAGTFPAISGTPITSGPAATYTIDRTAPTPVSITRASANPTNATSVDFTVTFNEAVTGVDAADFALTGTQTGASISNVSGSGTTWTVTVSTGAQNDRTVGLDLVDNDTIRDIATNVLGGAGTGNGDLTGPFYTVDNVSPTVTIDQSGTQADPTNGASIQFVVVFNEAVTGFDGADIGFAGSTAGGPLVASVSGSGASYTVTVTGMSNSGNVRASVLPGRAADALGNLNVASTSTDNTVVYDITPPTVTINQAGTQPDPTNAEPYHFVVVFNELVTGFDKNDILLSGTAGAQDVTVTATANPLVFDVFVTNTLQAGTVIADVRANAATDAAGNGNTASTSTDNTITGDTAPPIITVEQAIGQPDPTSTASIQFTVAFNESIDPTTFDASDIDLTLSTAGGTLVAVISPAPAVGVLEYTVTGMTTDGVVVARILDDRLTDLAGNLNDPSTSADNAVEYDTTPPTVTVEQAVGQGDPTNAAAIDFTVEFNESVSGFDDPTTDVLISGTAGGTLVAQIIQITPATYTVRVTGMTTTGTVIVDIPAGAADDLVSLPSDPSTSADNTVTFDNVAPDTTFVVTPPLFTPSADVTFLFGGSDDVTAEPALTYEYSLDGGSFVSATNPLDLFALAEGSHTIEVRATDEAGNTDATPATYTFTVDTVAPSVALSSAATDPTRFSPIPFTATFSEDVTTFDASDIQVTNGTVTSFSGSGSVYTFTVTPDNDGTVTVTIADGTAPDDAGNLNTGDAISRVFDTVRPEVTITTTATASTNVSPIPVTVTFSEEVFTFDASDLSLSNGTVANFTVVDFRTYTFDLIPDGDGTVFVGIAQGVAPDEAGNENVAATLTRVYDTGAPTVTVNQAGGQADPTNGSVSFTVVFSEPVTGFGATGLVLGGTAGPPAVTTVTGSGTTYTVTLSGFAQFGTVLAGVFASAATDAAGNPNEASTSTDNEVTFDPVVPTVTITPATGQRDPATVGPVVFTITFSKPVTGFTLSDISLAGSTAGGTLTATLTGSGAAYTLTVDGMTTPGDVTAAFVAGAAVDAAGNQSLAPTGDGTITYAGEVFAVGAGFGGAPQVIVYNGTGRVLFSFFAYDSSFRNGVHVATSDITGDGIPDIITGAGFGGALHVKAFDGRTGALIASFFAYDSSARGGVNVAVGDVNGDGRGDIVTGAGPTGAPHVKAFDGLTRAETKSFFAFTPEARGGVSVSAGDVNGDGRADIVTGNGLTSEVEVYDGVSLATLRRITPFYSPADSALPLGVYTAVGDVNGDGLADVVLGAGEGGGPLVQVYDGRTGVLVFQKETFAFDPAFRKGVTVTIRDMTGDGVGEIIAGSGDNGDVAIFDGLSLGRIDLLDPFGSAFAGGVFVG